MEALYNAEMPKLTSLNLKDNKTWWEDDDCFEYLLETIAKTNYLKKLDLGRNVFSSSRSEELLLGFLKSEILQSIVSIRFEYGLNFESNATCENLAKLIATAPVLHGINIKGQQGSRLVTVTAKWAVKEPEEAGFVTVTD